MMNELPPSGEFQYRRADGRLVVSKSVPIAGIDTNFSYGFMETQISVADRERTIRSCEVKINADIRSARQDAAR